jgi:hypothetical protein
VLSILLAVYCSGYTVSRATQVVIHRQGYSGDAVATHFVVGGDLSPTDPVRAATYSLMELAYTPMRYLELGAWYLVRPVGTPWHGHPTR